MIDEFWGYFCLEVAVLFGKMSTRKTSTFPQQHDQVPFSSQIRESTTVQAFWKDFRIKQKVLMNQAGNLSKKQIRKQNQRISLIETNTNNAPYSSDGRTSSCSQWLCW